MSWKVQVWLECEQRLGVAREQIESCIHSFVGQNRDLLQSRVVQKVPFHRSDSRWPEWCVFCYFDTSEYQAEAVDAAPLQRSRLGERWLRLLESHFRSFSMPWRTRPPQEVYAGMLSTGRRSVESLWTEVRDFLEDVEMHQDDKELCRDRLGIAETAIFNHHAAISRGHFGGATRELDTAIYHIHRLLYLAGESLGVVPRIGPESSPEGTKSSPLLTSGPLPVGN